MNTITLSKPVLPEWATLQYDNCVTSFDPSTLSIHLEPEQQNSYVRGNVLRQRLSNEQSANLATFQYLKDHLELLPDGWKDKCMFGWGTIVRDRHGDLRVPYLIEDDGRVELGWLWLGHGWDVDVPALRFASTQTLESEDSLSLSSLSLRIKQLEDWKDMVQGIKTVEV